MYGEIKIVMKVIIIRQILTDKAARIPLESDGVESVKNDRKYQMYTLIYNIKYKSLLFFIIFLKMI